MHDEGTGGNTAGGYGFFPLFPLNNCTFTSCPVAINARKAKRAANTDGTQLTNRDHHLQCAQSVAQPGYFSTQFVNGIQIEATSTRRAGLIRFTYPTSLSPNHVVIDLSNDLQRSFEGGGITIVPDQGRVLLNGTFLQVSTN